MGRKLQTQSGTRSLLTRILEEPNLVEAIRNLDSPALSSLIHHVGLEDAGELIALASTSQLERLLDEDVWFSESPGQEERFDPARFGTWLNILMEMGAKIAARKLTEMDEDFLALALSRLFLVINMDELTLRLSSRRQRAMSDEDLFEKALESNLYQEFEQYAVLSRDPLSWDAALAILIELDSEDHDYFMRLLERCHHLSSEVIEEHGGLFRLLTDLEQLETDAAQAREERMESEGYVPAQTAAAFLKLARGPMETPDLLSGPILKNLRERTRSSKQALPLQIAPSPLKMLLAESGVLENSQPRILLAGPASPDQRYPAIRSLLGRLHAEAPERYIAAMEEIGFLANTLVSGCPFGGRKFRSSEAAEAVLATCNLGLEDQSERQEVPLLEVFRKGWNRLYHEAIAPTAEKLLSRLPNLIESPELRENKPWIRAQLKNFESQLKKALAEGKPWTVRNELDLFQLWAEPEDLSLLASMLDECPAPEGRFLSSTRELREALQKVDQCFTGR